MAVSRIPVGPRVPPEVAGILQSHDDAIQALQQPAAPMPEFAIDTKADLLAQAPAADYPNCRAIVTDQGVPAWSINIAGTWTWVKADGSAL